jgi:membrane associated rhomboid family serine protease
MFPLRDDNPTSITPVVTWFLIALNVLVFFYQLSLGPRDMHLFAYKFGAIPAVITGDEILPRNIATIPPFLSIFTSIFLHGGWMHLIGNMWFLWIFGNNIEEAMGGLRYLLFYLICGFLASVAHILFNLSSALPSIGASGAIAGVLGAYMMLYPRAKVLTMIFLLFFIRFLWIPAGFVLGFWFVIQVWSGSLAGGQAGGGVAFWAHVGGFLAGVLLVGVFKKRNVRFFNPAHHSVQYYD